MSILFGCTQHNNIFLNICRDLKVITLLLDTQLFYTKLSCYLYEWEIRERSQYDVIEMPRRKQILPGKRNTTNGPLPENISTSTSHKGFFSLLGA
jgi:hypothetical protein